MIAIFMAAVVIMIVGFSLFPVIMEQIEQIQSASLGLSPIQITLLNLVPIFFALAIGLSVLGIIFSTIRGFLGYSEEYEEENADVPTAQKPHKQTYLEYVKERIAAQKLIHNS